jgi:hypothetical protein
LIQVWMTVLNLDAAGIIHLLGILNFDKGLHIILALFL